VLSRKALQLHRLNRSPIKLSCFAVSAQVKELVGYLVLDLRAANAHGAPRWMPLLNPRYKQHRPELKICLTLEAPGDHHDDEEDEEDDRAHTHSHRGRNHNAQDAMSAAEAMSDAGDLAASGRKEPRFPSLAG
jgi:hypothetical protein